MIDRELGNFEGLPTYMSFPEFAPIKLYTCSAAHLYELLTRFEGGGITEFWAMRSNRHVFQPGTWEISWIFMIFIYVYLRTTEGELALGCSPSSNVWRFSLSIPGMYFTAEVSVILSQLMLTLESQS